MGAQSGQDRIFKVTGKQIGAGWRGLLFCQAKIDVERYSEEKREEDENVYFLPWSRERSSCSRTSDHREDANHQTLYEAKRLWFVQMERIAGKQDNDEPVMPGSENGNADGAAHSAAAIVEMCAVQAKQNCARKKELIHP